MYLNFYLEKTSNNSLKGPVFFSKSLEVSIEYMISLLISYRYLLSLFK